MEYGPTLDPMDREKKRTSSQNTGRRIMRPAMAGVGIMPGNSPPRPALRNQTPRQTCTPPRRMNTARQSKKSKAASARSGAIVKERFGASSCRAMALPQSSLRTREVMAAMPEGRYSPAETPNANMASSSVG